MTRLKVAPGPGARSAFRMGIVAAAILALTYVGVLYWFGRLSLVLIGFLLLVVFPVYLVFVASILSVWLGYSKDGSDLRPVYREKKTP